MQDCGVLFPKERLAPSDQVERRGRVEDDEHDKAAGVQPTRAMAADDNRVVPLLPISERATRTRQFTGTIVRRRSLGRFLAFCDVRLDGDPADAAADTNIASSAGMLPTVFRAEQVVGDNFPTKKAALPYGARVAMTCYRNENGSNSNNNNWEVIEWQLLSSPHEQAVLEATSAAIMANGGGGGISCTEYLRSRREAFDAAAAVVAVPAALSSSASNTRQRRRQTKDPEMPTPEDYHHKQDKAATSQHTENKHPPNNKNKAVRAKVFAAWLVKNLLQSNHNNGGSSSSSSRNTIDRVLDVAGGKGDLSMALAALAGVACTIIDPVQRRRPRPRFVQHLVKEGKPVPDFVAGYFVHNNNNKASNDVSSSSLAGEGGGVVPTVDLDTLLQNHTCLVGLHPDQPTEDIVDAALRYHKSVAVVPCCVYPDLFSERRLRTTAGPSPAASSSSSLQGVPVRTYEQFLQYLLQKDPRLRRTQLPFDGKNECIYLKVDNDEDG